MLLIISPNLSLGMKVSFFNFFSFLFTFKIIIVDVIEVFLSLVGGQLTLEEKDWERFLKLLVAIANSFLDSKKFATLLFNIVSTKGIQIASQANEWKALVEKTNTFLKKPTLLALSKLNK